MAAPLEFYFDFASPYGYIGAQRIDAIAARHGRKIDWRPMLLGAVFKVAGTQPLTEYPLKGQYSVHDFNRSAREHGIAFNMPEKFPIPRSEEHTSELQSLMRISYAVFCLKKKKKKTDTHTATNTNHIKHNIHS